MNKIEMIRFMVDNYKWDEKELMNYNESQIRTLYYACVDGEDVHNAKSKQKGNA